MIRNERQYRITRAQAESFRKALDEVRAKSAHAGEEPNAKLKWSLQENALQSQLCELEDELREYDHLRARKEEPIEVGSFNELPDALVKARIATGLSQKHLAEKLGLKEQQIQRYEATRYAGVSLQRVQEIIDALGVKVRKQLFLPGLTVTPNIVYRRFRDLGFDQDFVRTRFFSSKLRAAVDRGETGEALEALVLDSVANVGRVFNWDPPRFFSEAPLDIDSQAAAQARFKLSASTNMVRVVAYTVYAHYLALLVLQTTSGISPKPIPASWRHIRGGLDRLGGVSLSNLLQYLWDLGVAVLPLNDTGHFHAATWRVKGRNIIVVKQKTKSEARWIVDLLHELWHASQNPELSEHSVIELLNPADATSDALIEEQIATDFAADVAFRGKADELAEECAQSSSQRLEWLKSAVQQVASTRNVRVDLLANYLAYRLSLEGEDWWGTATRLQTTTADPWEQVRDFMVQKVNLGVLSLSDRELLTQALQN